MLNELLAQKGFTEENIKDIIASINASEEYIPKGLFNSKLSEIKALKDDVAQRDGQLKDLGSKIGENENLQKEIAKMKADNDALKKQHNDEMKKFYKDNAILQKYNGSVYNIEDIKRVMNYDKIVLNERGEIIDGFEEQDKLIRETYPHYFKPSNAGADITGALPSSGGTDGCEPLTDAQKTQQASIDIVKMIRGIK